MEEEVIDKTTCPESKYHLKVISNAPLGWGYEISRTDTGEIILEGDDFDSEEDMIGTLSQFSEAFHCIFG